MSSSPEGPLKDLASVRVNERRSPDAVEEYPPSLPGAVGPRTMDISEEQLDERGKVIWSPSETARFKKIMKEQGWDGTMTGDGSEEDKEHAKWCVEVILSAHAADTANSRKKWIKRIKDKGRNTGVELMKEGVFSKDANGNYIYTPNLPNVDTGNLASAEAEVLMLQQMRRLAAENFTRFMCVVHRELAQLTNIEMSKLANSGH